MGQLKQVDNAELLQELKNRVMENKITEEEVFQTLEEKNIITNYKMADISKLTKEDWKKACQALEQDKNYQEEVKLWESIDNEDE